MEGAGVDGPGSILVEGAGVGGPLGAVKLEETAADVDGHATLARAVGFDDLAAVLSVGRGVGHGIVYVRVFVVELSIGVVPWKESGRSNGLRCGGQCRRVGRLGGRR